MTNVRTRTRLIVGVSVGLLLLIVGAWISARPVHATSFTVTPWAYGCGETKFGNPVATTCADQTAAASYTAGVLTLLKGGPTSADLAAGATIGGLVTLSAASADLGPESYCGAGAPRLNVVTSDGDTHFFGCAANRTGDHLSFDLSAAGDGNGKGGALGKTVTSIDFVQDEQGVAVLKNLTFEGNASPTPTPSTSPSASASPSATAAPHPSILPSTGGGSPDEPSAGAALLALGIVLLGIGALTYWRRTRS